MENNLKRDLQYQTILNRRIRDYAKMQKYRPKLKLTKKKVKSRSEKPYILGFTKSMNVEL